MNRERIYFYLRKTNEIKKYVIVLFLDFSFIYFKNIKNNGLSCLGNKPDMSHRCHHSHYVLIDNE